MINTMRFNDYGMFPNWFDTINKEEIEKEYRKRICRKPATNIIENEDSFLIEMVVPGIEKKEVNIDLDKNILTISHDQKKEVKEKELNFTQREFFYGDFCRSFALPEVVNVDNIKATYDKGILSVLLPKKEEAILKRDIKVS
jgi:HSP20 family protein